MTHPALLLLLLPVSAVLLQGAPSELQSFATLGVGGAIAGLVLVFYRADRKASEDRLSADRKASEERASADRKASEDRAALAARISEEKFAFIALQYREIITNHTAINTKLVTLLEQQKPGRQAH